MKAAAEIHGSKTLTRTNVFRDSPSRLSVTIRGPKPRAWYRVCERVGDPLGSMTIPAIGNVSRLIAASERVIVRVQHSIDRRRPRCQAIRALRNRHRSLSLFTQRYTWNAESGCLFLKSAGIRENDSRAFGEPEHLEVAEWLSHM